MSEAYDKATRFFDEAFSDLGLDKDGPYDLDVRHAPQMGISFTVTNFDYETVFDGESLVRSLAKVNERIVELGHVLDDFRVPSWMEDHYE